MCHVYRAEVTHAKAHKGVAQEAKASATAAEGRHTRILFSTLSFTIAAIATVGITVILSLYFTSAYSQCSLLGSGLPWVQPNVSHTLSTSRAIDVKFVSTDVNSGKSDRTPCKLCRFFVVTTLTIPLTPVVDELLLGGFDGDVSKMQASMQVADMWFREGDNVTIGMSQLSQEMHYYYMHNDSSLREADHLMGEALSALWLKDDQALIAGDGHSCLSDSYLPLTSVSAASTPGVYSFVIVKSQPTEALGEGAQWGSCETPRKEDVVRVLAKTSVNIGGKSAACSRLLYVIPGPSCEILLCSCSFVHHEREASGADSRILATVPTRSG